MKFFIFANWKMVLNAQLGHEIVYHTVERVQKPVWPLSCHVVVFPEAIHVQSVAQTVQNAPVSWGVQDVSPYDSGAYTGQVSPRHVADAGGQFAIIGHMEARRDMCYDDCIVSQKAVASVKAGLTPILCFGADEHCAPISQAKSLIHNVRNSGVEGELIFAFEPAGSIGTGSAMDVSAVQELAEELKQEDPLGAISFVYGGSVTATNISDFYNAGLDGVLVGGSSQKLEAWQALLAAIEGMEP